MKPGISPTQKILIDRSVWETVTGAPSSWFDWVLNIITPSYITASDLCALNPPDPVLPPVPTIAAAFFRDPSSIVTVFNYVRDKLTYSAFSFGCVCNASGTCVDQTDSGEHLQTNGVIGGSYTFGTKVHIVAAGVISAFRFQGSGISNQQTMTRARLLKVGTGVVYDVTVPTPIASGMHETALSTPIVTAAGEDYIVYWDNVAGGENLYYSGNTMPWNNGSVRIDGGVGTTTSGDHTAVTSGGDASHHWAQFVHCTGVNPPPDPPVVDPQPSDLPLPPAWSCSTVGDVCMRLLQVDQKIDWLIRSAPIVTSQSVAEGAVHAGLTGSGTLAVSAILGLRVLLTTIPSLYGSYPGNPVVHFGVGRVHWQTSEGWLQESLLDVTPKEILGLPPLVTTIGYTLAQGVVATIIELTKGP